MTLDLGYLQEQAVRRSAESYPQCATWSSAYWSNALAGEVGEHCNKIKKLERDHTHHPPIVDPHNYEKRKQARLDAGLELADVVIYATICAEKLGLRLEDLVREKFNQTSVKLESSILLE